jgi:L-threonylcarbamoyladenylate synthase
MPADFENDMIICLEVLKNGGTILYPTDTVWGIGCDATNAGAVKKVYELKQRDDRKSMIILVGDEKDILIYVAAPDLAVFDFLEKQTKPTTIIFDGAVGLPGNLIAEDGSIAIRIVKDDFCRHLVKRFRKPIVSTSANRSGEETPKLFSEITTQIKEAVDHVVTWRQNDQTIALPSQIIKWKKDGSYDVIRK